MQRCLIRIGLAAIAAFLLAWQPARAAGRLVDVQWLEQRLGDVLLLDASFAREHAKAHIAGAINVDLYGYGPAEPTREEMQKRLQSWGVSPGRTIVLYDQGGTFMATRLFFDLYEQGVPADTLHILDGGLARWQAAGKPVTAERTPAPAAGTFRIAAARPEVRSRLTEFIAATGDPRRHAVIEALEPTYHYGEQKFFDRAGHVPHAIMWPTGDLFNADKTFKSPAEIARMARYLGVQREQAVHTYCGGGVAASAPWFAMKFVLGWNDVRMYKESQYEYLQDERQLPVWTYDVPQLQRDAAWLAGWNGRMLRSFGLARISVIDVRSADAYKLGHVPYALHVPAEVFRTHLNDPAALAAALGAAGVDPRHEAVVVSDSGLDPRAALAWLALERLGQQRVSILMDPLDKWEARGHAVAREPTVVGARKSPQDLVVPATTYAPALRAGVVVQDAGGGASTYPRVVLAAGRQAPAAAPAGTVVHVPWSTLVEADGRPKAAKDLWNLLAKAGLPRYAEVVCVADDPGEAAAACYVLKLMGWPDVKVLAG